MFPRLLVGRASSTFGAHLRMCHQTDDHVCDLSNTGVLLYLILMYSTYCSSGVGPTDFLIAVFQRSGVPLNSPFVVQHLDAGLVAHCAAPQSTCFQRLCTHIDVAHRSTILAQRVRLFFSISSSLMHRKEHPHAQVQRTLHTHFLQYLPAAHPQRAHAPCSHPDPPAQRRFPLNPVLGGMVELQARML